MQQPTMMLKLALLLTVALKTISATTIRATFSNDLSQQTFGLQEPTQSQMTYNESGGLNFKGQLNDVFGPPLKIATGFNQYITGTGKTGAGHNLQAGSALLGLDANALEAVGGAKLVKGGLLLGGAGAKKALATVKAGKIGKKVASIIELPIKVVAVKDIAGGKTLLELGRYKQAKAEQEQQHGQQLVQQGDSLRQQGLDNIRQGAAEGLNNINSMVQQTANNAATAVKFLPMILEGLQSQSEQQQQQQHKQQQIQPQPTKDYQPHGPSLFGGLQSAFPSISLDPFNGYTNTNNNKGGAQQPNFAAVLSDTNPFFNLLTNPNVKPFLLPQQQQSSGTKSTKGSSISTSNNLFGADPFHGGLFGNNNNKKGHNSDLFGLLNNIRPQSPPKDNIAPIEQQLQEPAKIGQQQQQQQAEAVKQEPVQQPQTQEPQIQQQATKAPQQQQHQQQQAAVN